MHTHYTSMPLDMTGMHMFIYSRKLVASSYHTSMYKYNTFIMCVQRSSSRLIIQVIKVIIESFAKLIFYSSACTEIIIGTHHHIQSCYVFKL